MGSNQHKRTQLNGKVAAPVYKTENNGSGNPLGWPRETPLSATLGTNYEDKRQPLGRYSLFSLVPKAMSPIARRGGELVRRRRATYLHVRFV
jgi:hypothetical protein